jgi:putative Holliday junction resolvase
MGRILGLDFGTKRIGAALSDPRGRIATPLEVYSRRTPELDARHYRGLIEQEGVERLVVGLPVHSSGREGKSAESARSWGLWLAGVTGLPVTFMDERYTTAEAESRLQEGGLRARARKARRDMIAALILLQDYLDAGAPGEMGPPGPLDDAPRPPEPDR